MHNHNPEPLPLERELDREDYSTETDHEPIDESQDHIKDLENEQTGIAALYWSEFDNSIRF